MLQEEHDIVIDKLHRVEEKREEAEARAWEMEKHVYTQRYSHCCISWVFNNFHYTHNYVHLQNLYHIGHFSRRKSIFRGQIAEYVIKFDLRACHHFFMYTYIPGPSNISICMYGCGNCKSQLWEQQAYENEESISRSYQGAS
ncbi:hypothetical protein HanXRQr2_Chr08g0330291 [Helianthus annuus]|uniref:Uncharacterized protein n=1 Tax=Helianthus annuus TaxID=4232 RepID=A0A9K3NCP0_HELAN|nr:hypothetical protein HanXRQr2_Chr08g0330291 [Helianthus annuus]